MSRVWPDGFRRRIVPFQNQYNVFMGERDGLTLHCVICGVLALMNILTFREARARLKAVMDDVCTDHSPTVITRQNGEAVVMMSLADFNSIEETLYLLSSPQNGSRLLASFEQFKAGKARVRELDRNEQSSSEQ